MALDPIRIDIEVNEKAFEQQLKQAEKVSRDTKTKINQTMKVKFEMDIAQFQLKLAEVKKQLKTATGNQKISLQVEANQLQRGLTESKRGLNNLLNTGDATVSRLQQKFNGLGGAINYVKIGIASFVANLASSALTSFTNFLKSSVQEAIEGQRALAQLDAVLKSTGNTSGLTAEQVKLMATELSELNGIEDDVVLSAQNMLLTFTNIHADVLPQTTQAVIDLATAMNGGLTPSSEELRNTSIQVGKALNDPLDGLTKLTRIGVTFSKEQENLIRNFVKTGDVASAQRVILAELNKEFGGSAQAQLQTYAGKVQQLSVKWSNFKEAVGNTVIPVLSKMLDLLMKIGSLMGSINSGKFFDNTLGKIPAIQNLRTKLQATSFVKKLNAPIGGPTIPPETKTLTTSQQAEAKKILAGDYSGISTGASGGGGKTKAQKSADELKASFKSAFDSINSDIDKSKSKVDEYTTKIADLKKELEGLATERDKDVAKRVSEIDTLLAKKGEGEVANIEDGIVTNSRTKLEKERAEAFIGLTEKEVELLKTKITEQEKYDAMTDIGKIKADYDTKKKTIEDELALKQEQLTKEQDLYTQLNNTKLALEADYTAQFKSMINEQKTALDGLINKYKELAIAKSGSEFTGGINSVTNNNKTNNVNVNVNNSTQADSLTRKITK